MTPGTPAGPGAPRASALRDALGHDRVDTWLRAGAFAVALGSELAGRAAPARPDEVDALADRARSALRRAGATSGQGATA
ncbi:MAG TPA: hypothetical protein VNW94_18550 [Streptosporangiaceae bacterium]|nr:hypothetical protein [Streptosporangiaceae bacterium]